MFVEVAINLPHLRGTFDYHVPQALQSSIAVGQLITVPFSSRRAQGIIVGEPQQPEVEETRPIEGLVDTTPVITSAQLELARWMAQTYRANLIECLALMLPPGLSQQTDTLYHLVDPQANASSGLPESVLQLLKQRGDLRGRQLARAFPRRRWRPALDKMIQQGIVERSSILDPPRIQPQRIRTARLATPPEVARQRVAEIGRPDTDAYRRRICIIETLTAEGEPLEAQWIYAECGCSLSDLRKLEEHNLIILSDAEVWRDPLEEIEFVPSDAPILTRDQAHIWHEIEQQFEPNSSPPHKPILLHGVTGSGKTEIYLQAVARTLEQGRTAIVLVPEIALTPQTVRRFLARFPGRVGLQHSQLSPGERFDTWRRCRSGELSLMIGPRSAIFMPLNRIGLIVLDESHDESYKEQARAPRYHTRHVAMQYARIAEATCILGSASPDITSRYAADRGELQLLTLPKRIMGHGRRLAAQAQRFGLDSKYKTFEAEAHTIELPAVRLVDMRQELKSGNRSIFSRALTRALEETLAANQQAILFLNRRGSSTYIFCRDCGWVAGCPRCATSLIHHEHDSLWRCHHCGMTTPPKDTCPDCQGERVRHFGTGTQKVQSEIETLFPGVRTLRWDWDATRTKGAHEIILAHFAAHRADVLIGTQMLAKGLDLPLVTLVGVISADIGLNLPDYRSAERTFQVLMQVAGRAGRGLLGGRVVLQTFQPDHYVIQFAAQHDYQGFYQRELSLRRELGYPPYSRLVRLIYRHPSNAQAESETERLADQLKSAIRLSDHQIDLIGPAPCFFQRVRGLYRWHIILRGSDPATVLPENFPEGWGLDIDPVSLL
ncbi:MAG: primosomal protein N' [Anaerolineales bacterium]|nr:MAG: primosomal protein N' [Anaerolineales bacterium]